MESRASLFSDAEGCSLEPEPVPEAPGLTPLVAWSEGAAFGLDDHVVVAHD